MKKILLLGEFSGLHTNLKEGLEELGYDVTMASAGDGKKEIDRDIDISLNGRSPITLVNSILENRKKIKDFKNYDLVQFINPYIQPKTTLLHYPYIFKNNKKVVCLGAGDDIVFSDFVKGNGLSKYSPFDDELNKGVNLPYENSYHKYIQKKLLNQFDFIIPNAYEYAEAYRNSSWCNKVLETIPFPINCNKIPFKRKEFKGKIVIYHASNRPTFKGSEFINKALKIIEKKFPNKVEVISADFLPLEEYLNAIDRAHIIIDQCRSYSYAMNALYSLAKGKIVLSGCENECLVEWNLEESPIVNITPNVVDIVEKLEYLILSSESYLEELSLKSRKHVEQNHNHIEIAKRFLKAWGI